MTNSGANVWLLKYLAAGRQELEMIPVFEELKARKQQLQRLCDVGALVVTGKRHHHAGRSRSRFLTIHRGREETTGFS